MRADAQRNIAALLEAAKAVFIKSGVAAPVREIAQQAGVGVGTVYRHFPQRSDLIVAVIRHEVDRCADAAASLAKKHRPFEALTRWMHRYVELIAAKRGLAAALHSGDPAYDALPAYFQDRLCPALESLLEAAAAAGEIRQGIAPYDLLLAVAGVCSMSSHPAVNAAPDHSQRMVELLLDGLRYRGR
ncbi:MAG: TetR/AcrR family transcriptional regulator [Pirellulales bacterium]